MSFVESIQYIQCFPHDVELGILPKLRESGEGPSVARWVITNMPNLTYMFLEFLDEETITHLRTHYRSLSKTLRPTLIIYNRYHTNK